MSGVAHLVGSGPLLLAVPIAAAAGAVTFLSPCVLPLVPGYLSYVTGMSGVDAQRSGTAAGAAVPVGTPAAAAVTAGTGSGGAGGVSTVVRPGPGPVAARARHGRAVAGVALFVLGFSVLFATEGVAFGSLGSLLRSHTAGITQILGGLTILLGLLFAGVFDRLPLTGRIVRPSFRPRAGLAGAPLLGVLFGLGWTPCLGPTMGVVMTLAFTSGTAVRGALLMFVFGLGLGVPFLVVALVFQRAVTALGFARRHARAITRAGGAMLVAVGVLEVTGLWTAALAWLQTHWAANYQLPL